MAPDGRTDMDKAISLRLRRGIIIIIIIIVVKMDKTEVPPLILLVLDSIENWNTNCLYMLYLVFFIFLFINYHFFVYII